MSSQPSVTSAALLIAGTAVGAGVLGVPVKTGPAGVWPSVAAVVVVWVALLGAGMVLARSFVQGGDLEADLASLYFRELGPLGKWLAVAGYLVIFYGLMVAYLAGSASVLSGLLGLPGAGHLLLLAFFIPASALALFGLGLVRRANVVLMILLGASFVYLTVRAGTGLEAARLTRMDWRYLPAILPMITCALGYGVIIPSVCRSLNGDLRLINRALVMGTAIAAGINLLWIAAVIGAVPLDGPGPASLALAFLQNQPATLPLAASLASTGVVVGGLIFSLCGILTSYIAVAVALSAFHKDLWGGLWPGRNEVVRAAMIFGPPLVVVYLNPDIFLVALDWVGGLGIALIFGLGPALMCLKPGGGPAPGRKALGLSLLLFFGLVIVLEIIQEAGGLRLGPGVEHWKIRHPGGAP